MTNEMNRPPAIVTDSALKNAPVTPVRKASGAKMTSVAALEPASGRRNSVAASRTVVATGPPSWRSRRRRMMCSVITIASSMIRPTAAAMPPRVMTLKLMFISDSSSTVIASTVGTTATAMSVTFRLRRNSSSTPAASTAPMRIASRTLAAEATTRSLWSYQLATWMSGGSCAFSSANLARTSAAICTLLLPGCW